MSALDFIDDIPIDIAHQAHIGTSFSPDVRAQQERTSYAAVRKVLQPELQPIMSGDTDALQRLAAKIEEAEKQQEGMKAVNAVIRKHSKAGIETQVAALIALGYSETAACGLLTPDSCNRIGFADYELTNNSANIRRMKARLEQISRIKTEPAINVEGGAARLEDVPAENRIRLFFPGKPDVAIRSRLKSSGFRWAPSIGCWQAYRNPSTLAIAREVAEV